MRIQVRVKCRGIKNFRNKGYQYECVTGDDACGGCIRRRVTLTTNFKLKQVDVRGLDHLNSWTHSSEMRISSTWTSLNLIKRVQTNPEIRKPVRSGLRKTFPKCDTYNRVQGSMAHLHRSWCSLMPSCIVSEFLWTWWVIYEKIQVWNLKTVLVCLSKLIILDLLNVDLNSSYSNRVFLELEDIVFDSRMTQIASKPMYFFEKKKTSLNGYPHWHS